jgi:hypothetical protein
MKQSQNLVKVFLLVGFFGIGLMSCSKSKDVQEPEIAKPGAETKKEFVFVVTSEAAGEGGGAGSYVVSSENVSSGEISIVGKGIPSNEFYFNVQNNLVFGLTYSNQGPITPYGFGTNGKLTRFDNKTVNAVRPGIFGNYGTKNTIIGSTNRSLTDPVATLMNYNAESFLIQNQANINLAELAGNGRMAIWTGLFQVGDKIYIPYQIAEGEGNWGGNITEVNKTTIAVLSYPELKLIKKISDDRGSFVGNWGSQQGIGVLANGDAYTWFTSGTTEGGLVPKNPSGMLRVKKGTDEFDKSYFFNVEALGKGKIARGNYISGTKFLMTLYASTETGGVGGGKVKLAIVDAEAKTVSEISGAPVHDQTDYNNKIYIEKDGKTAYYVMQEDNKEFYVYVIDVATATAKRGARLRGITNVAAFSKLEY